MKNPKFKNIVIKSAISNENITIKAEIIKTEKHGYDSKDSGSWSLYGGYGYQPAKFLIYRKYRNQRPGRINMNRVVAIKDIE